VVVVMVMMMTMMSMMTAVCNVCVTVGRFHVASDVTSVCLCALPLGMT